MKRTDEDLKKAAVSASLDDELAGLSMEADEDFDRRIEKIIARRVKKIVIKTVLFILIVAVAVIGCLNPLTRAFFPDAVEMTAIEGDQPLTRLLAAYYETMTPFREVTAVEAASDGFGRYTVYLTVRDLRESFGDERQNVRLSMNWGRLDFEEDENMAGTFELGTFYDEGASETENPTSVIDDLKKLPQSAYIYVSVSEREAREVSALAEEAGGNLVWLQVYEPQNDFQAGVCAQSSPAAAGRPGAETAAQLKENYLDNLRLLQDNISIWQGLGAYSNSSVYPRPAGQIEAAVEAAETGDRFMSKNYCLAGARDEIVGYLKSRDCAMLKVEKVKYSRFD